MKVGGGGTFSTAKPPYGCMYAPVPCSFFVVPVDDVGTAAAELNRFLRSRRVLSVDRRWVDLGTESFWTFRVDYLDSGGGGSSLGPRDGARRGKFDDREVLAPDDFAVFVRLRQLRKEIPQSECW